MQEAVSSSISRNATVMADAVTVILLWLKHLFLVYTVTGTVQVLVVLSCYVCQVDVAVAVDTGGCA